MDKILYYLCRHSVSIMDGWLPYPAWAIAKQAGVSLSTARRKLRKLKQEGLAATFSVSLGEESDFALPYHGWGVTKKTYQTEEYKKASEEEEKILREVFGTDMFPESKAILEEQNEKT